MKPFGSTPLEPTRTDASHKAAILVFLAITLLPCFAFAQNVSIGTATANTSALLHLESTSQGFLMPRMTHTQMLAITTPATGDIVWNTTYTNYYYYTGVFWTPLVGSGWSLTGDAGTSASTNFLGTIDSQDVVQKTNFNERMRFFAAGNIGLTNKLNSAEALIFYESSGSGSGFTGFKAGVQAGTVHYIWPLAGDGIANQALVTNGAGQLSWHTFATFGGSGSQSLWKRGSAGGGECSDSSGNSDSGPYSIEAGHNNTVTGNYEIVWGNANQGVSGSYGAILGGSTNGSSGNLDVVGGGMSNSASATASYIGGGSNNSTSGNEEVVLGGSGNSFSGSNSTILGGTNNKTSCNQELLYGNGFTGGTCGSVVFKMGSNTRMGIGTVAPSEFLDVVGNVKLSGALKPNGSGGSNGNFLLSAGAGAHPTWGSISIPSTNWGLTGTSGSSPSTNFIGTTDAQDFVTRTNSIERARIESSGQIGINTSSLAHQLASLYTGTANEIAAIYANASGTTSSQSTGIWGRADNTSSTNTGTLANLATGNRNITAGTTNVALQISQGEFTMGRTTENPSVGTLTGAAASGTLYSQQGPSGVIQLSLQTDLTSVAPTSGVFQNLGTLTINNRYLTANSIIIAGIVAKTNGGGSPDPKNSTYKVDVESRTAGACTVRVGMIPFATDPSSYQGSDYIQLAYAVINPGR